MSLRSCAAVLAIIAGVAATSATQAGFATNGLTINGLTINGRAVRGSALGVPSGGSRVTSVILQDGSTVAVR
ncbi:hypothetical protein HPT29_017010 [Microvirga terrae]|uniref:Uncharacterized protein n=1 Tax=Microvirga terrae TaxID=2740529 RepID=A0ABY5RMK4_9HYPH|nr:MULTISPECIES: hypothetical protein [Microvirga]MBQ0824317.1 hypothetical protein [Microvirga sp. HBU67558]UVF18203.1 hypothetical protein HPT29_017010 [Microvirga terrae]